MQNISQIGAGFVSLLTVLILLYISRIFYAFIHRKDLEAQLVQHDNPAVALTYIGFMSATGAIFVAMAGGESQGLLSDIIFIVKHSAIGIALLLVADTLYEKVFHSTLPGTEKIISERNLAAGIARGSFLAATGLLIAGSLLQALTSVSAQDSYLVEEVITPTAREYLIIVIYFVLGQSILSLAGFTFRKFAGYDVKKHILENNVAAGIAYGSTLLSVGVILYSASQQELYHWFEVEKDMSHLQADAWNLVIYVIFALFGLIYLPIMRVFFDKIWIPGVKMVDEITVDKNWGIAAVEAFLLIILAVLFTHSLG